MKKNPRVIDFFCGAGGFSEGFRQQDFDIVMGIDNWSPAIETHNINHNLLDKVKNVLVFEESIDEIDRLPDTEVIIGSPPCVLFSTSNRGGNTDKTYGIRLIKSFLRVIAIKKHKPGSKLIAWFMENVPNSKNYILPTYSFLDLNLGDWARKNGLNPNDMALKGTVNSVIVNTLDYASAQKRKRFLCGEIIVDGKFPDLTPYICKTHKSLQMILAKMPPPTMEESKKLYEDPNYPSLKIPGNEISDHYYDTGIYEIEWKKARDAKLNHPYMGKMSFPENFEEPSRTVVATRSKTSREALIYKSEYERKGNGEYRLPTIREIATIMSFPYTYQFSGGEAAKWRLIGNAVPPSLSAVLAMCVRKSMGLNLKKISKISFKTPNINNDKIINLNTYHRRLFDKPPKRKQRAKFRMHPFKDGNITVALTNFNPHTQDSMTPTLDWYSSMFIGTGKGFIIKVLNKNSYKNISKLISGYDKNFSKKYFEEFDKEFEYAFGKTSDFQDVYVGNIVNYRLNPSILVEKIGKLIKKHVPSDVYVHSPQLIPEKKHIPLRQIYAIYSINRLIS